MLLNGALIGVGYAGLWLMIPSMQVDVVDYDELNTGERREGSFASIFSWVLKLSFCMGYLIAGPLIEMTGFDAALGGEQATEVLNKMRVGYLVIPVAALVAALMILKYFPINRAKAAEIRNELETRRGVI
jgi:GPH family glycoside/pentoside/hexuronide:cation symporter